VGGTARDLLLGRPFSDRDYVTDATPEEEKAFLPAADYTFERYGSIRLENRAQKKSISRPFRKEEGYQDFRHPGRSYVSSRRRKKITSAAISRSTPFISMSRAMFWIIAVALPI
jgi:tRNA nucleotidyltransferase/poly(A) polymerase